MYSTVLTYLHVISSAVRRKNRILLKLEETVVKGKLEGEIYC